MLVKTHGIILKSIKYSESSNIVEIYTRELGTRTYIFNSVRTQKPKISPSLIQPLSLVDLVVYETSDRKINRVKEIKTLYQFKELPYEIVKSSIGLFIIEIISKTVKESESNPILFDFIEKTLVNIDNSKESLPYIPCFFMIEYTTYLGIMPESCNFTSGFYFDLKEGIFIQEPPAHSLYLNEKLSLFLNIAINNQSDSSTIIDLNYYERQLLIDDLVKYYNFHLDKEISLKTVTVLNQIFS
jgi:DNA repair protein RecO (recombination protein O)